MYRKSVLTLQILTSTCIFATIFFYAIIDTNMENMPKTGEILQLVIFFYILMILLFDLAVKL